MEKPSFAKASEGEARRRFSDDESDKKKGKSPPTLKLRKKLSINLIVGSVHRSPKKI
jgi:hypothetical protein